MVQDVKSLRPELNPETLRNFEILVQRVVQIPQTGADNGVPASIAECSGRLKRIAVWIKPPVYRFETRIEIASGHYIWTAVPVAGSKHAVRRRGRAKREPRHVRENSGKLPTSEDGAGDALGVVRQLIH